MGNKIFEYVFSSLLALKNNLHLETEWPHQEFIKIHPFVGGERYDNPVVEVSDMYHNQHDRDWFNESLLKKHLVVHGFFQHPKYYDKYKDILKSFFNLPPIQKRPFGDIVMHYRLGDYYEVGKGGSVIHPTWYTHILMHKIKWNRNKHRLFIVTDSPDDKILKNFHRFHPQIISGEPKNDFEFIRQFDTILCGNSSFSWWASYLSEATRIYTFSRWINEPHNHIIRLAFFKGAAPVNGKWL